MKTYETGELLKALRKTKGMTQEELGDFLNVSHKTVSKWENGLGLPEISTLLILADFYKISVDDLLRGSKKKVQQSNFPNEHYSYMMQKSKHRFTNHLIISFGFLTLGLLAFNITRNLALQRTVVLMLMFSFIVSAAIIQSLSVNRVIYQYKELKKVKQEYLQINSVYYYSLVFIHFSLWLTIYALLTTAPWIHTDFNTGFYSSFMPSLSIASLIILLLHSSLSVVIAFLKQNKPSIQVKIIMVMSFLTVSIPFVILNYVKENYLNSLVNHNGHYDWLYINDHTHLRYELYGFMVSRGLIFLVFIALALVGAQKLIKKKQS